MKKEEEEKEEEEKKEEEKEVGVHTETNCKTEDVMLESAARLHKKASLHPIVWVSASAADLNLCSTSTAKNRCRCRRDGQSWLLLMFRPKVMLKKSRKGVEEEEEWRQAASDGRRLIRGTFKATCLGHKSCC